MSLPEHLSFERLGRPGVRYTWRPVEFRRPVKGEYYLSGAIPQAFKAPSDLSTAYMVVVPVAPYVYRKQWVAL
jgi:hypothetical protein